MMPKKRRKPEDASENEEKTTSPKRHDASGAAQSSTAVDLPPLYHEAQRAGNFLGDVPGDVFMINATPYLTAEEQYGIGLTNSRDTFFRTKEKSRLLMNLITNYVINKPLDRSDAFTRRALEQPVYLVIDGKSQRIQNPILLFIYALLIEEPNLLTFSHSIVDFSNRGFVGSAARYISWSSNFMLKELVIQLIPGGAVAIATEMATIIKMETNYDLLLITLPATTTIAEVNYDSLILCPEGNVLPIAIKEASILFQKSGDELKTYRMRNDVLTLDKIISLIPLTNRLAELNQLPSQNSIEPLKNLQLIMLQLNTKEFVVLRIQDNTIANNNHIICQLLTHLCGYLPPLPNAPTLIKQVDSNNNIVLTQWGFLNGRLQATPVTYKIFEMPRAKLDTNKLPPIQDGVIVVYDGEDPDDETVNIPRQYQVFYAYEGLWSMQNNMLITVLAQLSPQQLRNEQLATIKQLFDTVGIVYPAQAFIDLPFPVQPGQINTMSTQHLTQDQYFLLRRGNLAYFDLREYLRGFTAFYQKYSANEFIPANMINQANSDWHNMVGKIQFYMTAWLAQVWCSGTAFDPPPDVNDLILQTTITKLNLNQSESVEDFFYNPRTTAAISKGIHSFAHRTDAIVQIELPIEGNNGVLGMINSNHMFDLAPMLRIQELITARYEYEKSMYLSVINTPRPQQ